MKLLTGLPWISRLGFALTSYGPNSVLLYKAPTPKDGQIELYDDSSYDAFVLDFIALVYFIDSCTYYSKR